MKPIPQHAFTQVSGFEAKKHNMRQTNDGLWQVTLTVHEFGNADWLIHAAPGTPLAVGLKAMDYDNPERLTQTENPLKKFVTRAALFCKDNSFQVFLGCRSEAEASTELKDRLSISSRAELADPDNTDARELFDEIVEDFKEWKKQNA